MTEAEAIDVVSKLKYKPGSRFNCWRADGMDAIQITISLQVEDACYWKEKEKPVIPILTQAFLVYEALNGMTERDFLDWIKYQTHLMERHESTEWLRFDGKLLEDPHPGIARYMGSVKLDLD